MHLLMPNLENFPIVRHSKYRLLLSNLHLMELISIHLKNKEPKYKQMPRILFGDHLQKDNYPLVVD